ncbi:MAG TPA: glycosyltransferase family 39 protein, partial [Urbifossiella sp.]|nr:glycosyltransferase family 39 protein [Urbifossiella sp.]
MTRRDMFVLGFIAAGAAWLRFGGLGARSLWFDETLSWRLIGFSWGELLERTGEPSTVHPPAYFLLLKAWAAVWGDTEVALRSFSALAGTAAVAGSYFLVRELQRLQPGGVVGGVGPPLAAALVAVSVLQVHLSQNARGYALAAAVYVATAVALLRALRTGRPRDWLGFIATALLLVYTHHVGFFHLAALVAFAGVYLARGSGAGAREHPQIRRQIMWVFASGTAVAVGYAPWASALLGQVSSARNAWSGGAITAETVWVNVPRETFAALSASFAAAPPAPSDLATGVTLVLTAVLVALGWRGGWPGRFLCLIGLVPPLLLLAQSGLGGTRTVYLVRYLALSQLGWLVALGYAISRIRPRPERWASVGLVLVWATYCCFEGWDAIGPAPRPGAREAVAYVLEHRGPGEPVVARTSFIFYSVDYYTRGHAGRPRLYGTGHDRFLYRNASQLRDSDVITPDELRAMNPAGVWFITTESYSAGEQFFAPEPAEWVLESTRTFTQGDYPHERPITVE